MIDNPYTGRQGEIAELIFKSERYTTDHLSPLELARLFRVRVSVLRVSAVESGRLRKNTYYIVPPGDETHPEHALYPAQDFLSFSISFPSKEELEKLAFFQYRTVSKENISFAFILERVFENETRKAFRNLRRYAFCLRHLALLSEIRYSVLLALLEESSKKCRHYEKEADYSISAGKERFFRTVQAIAQREVSVLMNELSKRGSL